MSEKLRIGNSERDRCIAIGMAMAMPIITLGGVVLCIATDTLGLLGVAPALGLTMGIAIGEGLYQRRRQNEENQK